jgi:hypothetical protein
MDRLNHSHAHYTAADLEQKPSANNEIKDLRRQ